MLTRYFSLTSFSIIETSKCHVWRKNTLVRHCTKKHIFLNCVFSRSYGGPRWQCQDVRVGSLTADHLLQESRKLQSHQDTIQPPGKQGQYVRDTEKTGIYQNSAEYLPALSPGPPYDLTIRCRSHPECWQNARKYVFKKAKELKEHNLIF